MYKCMYTSVRPCNIYMTVNILVKHPRSGLPPTVLYNLLYLHYMTLHELHTNEFGGYYAAFG